MRKPVNLVPVQGGNRRCAWSNRRQGYGVLAVGTAARAGVFAPLWSAAGAAAQELCCGGGADTVDYSREIFAVDRWVCMAPVRKTAAHRCAYKNAKQRAE